MGSNMASDSGSEPEIQQSLKKKNMDITEIPDSDIEDADDALPTPNTSKLKGIIEHINADSDDDDDDHHDPPVDFGEEEEEEDDSPTPAKVTTPAETGKEEEKELQVTKMDIDDENNKQTTKATANKSISPSKRTSPAKSTSPSKTAASSVARSRSKKVSNIPLGKSIKKPGNTGKGRTKATKKTSTTKKSAPPLKPAAQDSSSPKPQKKSSAKAVSKADSKASSKAGKKSETEQAGKVNKSAKPKKTIDKAAKSGTKKALHKLKDKQTTSSANYSKKTKANDKASATQSGKGQKAKGSKVKSPTKKVDLKKKKKGKKAEEEVGEEGDSGDVEVTSESEASDGSSDVDDDELMSTPKSKLPIIGSLACSSRDANTQALLDHAVQQLGKYRAVNYGPDSDVNLHAYIISGGTKRGWGVLQALASGAQLVSEDWLSSSISEGSWQPMSAFISDRFGKSPRSVVVSDGRGGILHGMRIKVACKGQDEPSVRKLVRLCGARVAETRAEVCINDTNTKVEDYVNVTKKWLADSVESGLALEFQPYEVESG